MESEVLYQLALTQVPHIGPVQTKILVHHFGEASALFKATRSVLEKIEGIGEVRAKSISKFKDFERAEQELKFIEKYKIKTLFLSEKGYPKRLLNCYDPPTLLFYRGSADLNAPKVLAIVGTRSNTDYGRQFTEKLVKDLSEQDIVIISGLAHGIDAIAHEAAWKNKLPTVGVVGHGLDELYPPGNRGLAKDMVKNGGGILSEFFSGTKPHKHNFPLRNRVVAGLSDATVLVETKINGGSMITAKIANAYNRDVFAVPGRTDDKASSGCNHLIQHGKAHLLTDARELLDLLGWAEKKKDQVKQQKELFIELSAEEKQVLQLFREKEPVHFNEIILQSGLSSSAAAAAIMNLELHNLVAGLPGNLYRLL